MCDLVIRKKMSAKASVATTANSVNSVEAVDFNPTKSFLRSPRRFYLRLKVRLLILSGVFLA